MDEIKEALAYQRKCLKIRLWRERASTEVWVADDISIPCALVPHALPLPAGVVPLPSCIFCGHLIRHPDDCAMHEWLIKRNALPVKLQHLIMHEYNCVLAHNDCHDRYGQTREFKLRSAKAQYKAYGAQAIKTWVAGLMLRQVVGLPDVSDL